MIREEPDPDADRRVDPPQKTRSRFVIGEGDARITDRRPPDDAEVKEADRLLSKVLRRRDPL
ncbi:hypothetical protein RJ53_05825 [Methanocalculus chunghsingensis]|uniref:Uncharacterized protein n=1 Tax=Methanocalculus chunghsingensis TaxID=156457 RepID=A0A8J7W9D5_9EURY|nr:hypothetical protein [Methanocalculus chunghsingensis]MBR1369045.1 hypothetical protein [Methanocalculus chunghsingensis]